MSYKSLINSNLTLAFKLLKDLAVNTTLRQTAKNDFDFGTAEMDTGKVNSTVVKAVVIMDDKKSKKHNSVKRQLLFRAKGLTDIDSYDSVDIPDDVNPKLSVNWKFGPKLNSDGYIVLAEIYREV